MRPDREQTPPSAPLGIRTAPGGYPVVGHMPAFARDRLAFFSSCASTSGNVVRCQLAGAMYVLNDPADIRHVLVTNHSNYAKSRRVTGARTLWPSHGSLITSGGREHQRLRRRLQPVFRQQLVDRLGERSRVNARALVDGWGNGDEIDVTVTMSELAERNILETLFGSCSERWRGRLARSSAARRRFTEHIYFSLSPFPEYMPVKANFGQIHALRLFDRAVAREIRSRREGSVRRDDMLTLLMDATDGDGRTMTDRELRAEVLTFSLTGYESVGEALAWTLLVLGAHPPVQTAVAHELAAAANGDSIGSQWADVPYTRRVISEAMRLFPPTWLFTRRADAEDALPSGARIPGGSQVCISPWVIHRNPRLWPDPEHFDPDRFLDGASQSRPRYAYLPFGGGPHTCIGESLALAEIVAVLACITSRYRVLPGVMPTPEPGITLRPKGLRMRVVSRTAPA